MSNVQRKTFVIQNINQEIYYDRDKFLFQLPLNFFPVMNTFKLNSK